MSRSLKIINAEHVGGHRLKIYFSDDKIQIVDFNPFLEGSKHPEIKRFLALKHFKNFRLKDGELMWGDFDLVFPIMDLYRNQIQHERHERKVSGH